jgi:DNA-binding transcriptional LysR family regulator
MDRFDAMTAFVTVAELEGFGRAARRLGHSPSAVTRLVAGLEAHLGQRLLQRTTRKVSLTDGGRRYLLRARRILLELKEAEEALVAERAAPTGRFVVAAPNLFGRLHVARALSLYLAKYPAVTGELTLSDRPVNLVDEGVDLAIRIGVLPDSSLVARTVGYTRKVVVASPDYLARAGTPKTPAQLVSHRLVAFTPLAPADAWTFYPSRQARAFPVNPSFLTNSGDVAIGHALGGGGLAMVLAYQVAEAVRRGRLKVVLAGFEPPPLPIQLVFPTNRLLSAKVRTFIERVTQTCDWRFVEL